MASASVQWATSMRILLGPDKFKDAASAEEVCAAMAAGVVRVWPKAELIPCPLGDGGEGTGRVLAQALGAREEYADVLDPLGRQRAARWWFEPARKLALIEMAEASGLSLLKPHERDPLKTTSFGSGQLMAAALDAGALRVLLCIGGSATVDGGAGCLQALGWRLLDAAGRTLPAPITGGMLVRVAAITPPPRSTRPELIAQQVEVLCDVQNPLLGPSGAAAVFGPQKGASAPAVAELEVGLASWASVLERCTGKTVSQEPGAGAAGGMPAGLAPTLGAVMVPGFDRVAELIRLDKKLRGCQLCLTGEGRLDEQTAAGKVIAGLARRAAKFGTPVIAFVGAARCGPTATLADLAAALRLRDIVVITPRETPLERALVDTAKNLQQAVQNYLSA